MTSKIDEMINRIGLYISSIDEFRNNNSNAVWGNGAKEDYIINKIALAYLQAHKDRLVLVPVEPTDKMFDEANALSSEVWISDDLMTTREEKEFVIEYGNFGEFLSRAIQARPKTALDEIIEGIENE